MCGGGANCPGSKRPHTGRLVPGSTCSVPRTGPSVRRGPQRVQSAHALSTCAPGVQAERAAALVAEVRSMAASAPRPPKRGRTARLDHYVGPPAHLLVGARISVFWPDDDAFYKVRRPGGGSGAAPLCPVAGFLCGHHGTQLANAKFTWGVPTAILHWVVVQADSIWCVRPCVGDSGEESAFSAVRHKG